jgi:hypothetical protein
VSSIVCVCVCVLYYCHWVATQLQLTNIYHIISLGDGARAYTKHNSMLKICSVSVSKNLEVKTIIIGNVSCCAKKSELGAKQYGKFEHGFAVSRVEELIGRFKTCYFLGEFAKLLRAIMSIVMSVCPSVRIETLDSHWTDFHDVLYWNIFRKSIERTRFVTIGYV